MLGLGTTIVEADPSPGGLSGTKFSSTKGRCLSELLSLSEMVKMPGSRAASCMCRNIIKVVKYYVRGTKRRRAPHNIRMRRGRARRRSACLHIGLSAIQNSILPACQLAEIYPEMELELERIFGTNFHHALDKPTSLKSTYARGRVFLTQRLLKSRGRYIRWNLRQDRRYYLISGRICWANPSVEFDNPGVG